MKLTKKTLLIFLVFLTFVTFVLADTLVLKDGRVLQGTYKGGDETSVFFEVEGKQQAIPLFDITTITFSPREEAVEVGSTGQTQAGAVTVPAGSRVLVKLTQPVSTASHKKGASVTGVLATGLAVNGQVVVPPGTKIHGKVLESRGGRVLGGMKLVLTFTDLEINAQLVPIVTDQIGAEAGRGGTLKKVGAGALIGAALDGSSGYGRNKTSGAAKGAAVGGAIAILSSRKNHIQIPADYQVEVSLTQPLILN
ncbi:MAG: hypothetical protein KAT01_11525 [Candidatus Aminicenantes bacterium]|nr:hypothetical protein [Candidatus Aminicenantes bacterium]